MTPHSAYEQPVSAYAALSQDHVRYEAPQGAKRSGGLRGEECHYEVVDAKQRREQGQGMGARTRSASRGKDVMKMLMHVLCLMLLIGVWNGNAADATAADSSETSLALGS